MEVTIAVYTNEEMKLVSDLMTELFTRREKERNENLKAFAEAFEESETLPLKKPARKPKPEPVSAPQAAPEPEVIKEPSNKKPEPVVIDADVSYTTENVREAVVDLSAALGSDAARSLLLEFGARKASEVPVEKIGDFVKAAKAKISDRANTLVD